VERKLNRRSRRLPMFRITYTQKQGKGEVAVAAVKTKLLTAP
jgi:hypothetical protein